MAVRPFFMHGFDLFWAVAPGQSGQHDPRVLDAAGVSALKHAQVAGADECAIAVLQALSDPCWGGTALEQSHLQATISGPGLGPLTPNPPAASSAEQLRCAGPF